MPVTLSRRSLIRLAAVGGVVFASRLGVRPGYAAMDEFYFVQLSDLHWGFQNPKVNPDPRATLEKAIAAINAAPHMPDFVVFTGDLTHITKDAQERRRRMGEVRAMLGTLKVNRQFYLPGEHDAALDRGAAFQEFFGPLHQAFDHKGLHFVALDNTSDPHGLIGDAQLAWLAADLKGRDPNEPIVVLAHRPLFALKPDWDWFTRDGDKAIALLSPVQEGDGVLWPHPPAEHAPDRRHHPHCRTLGDVSPARARRPAEEGAAALERRRRRPRHRLARDRRRDGRPAGRRPADGIGHGPTATTRMS